MIKAIIFDFDNTLEDYESAKLGVESKIADYVHKISKVNVLVKYSLVNCECDRFHLARRRSLFRWCHVLEKNNFLEHFKNWFLHLSFLF